MTMVDNLDPKPREQRDDGAIGWTSADQSLYENMRDADEAWSDASEREHDAALSDAHRRLVEHDDRVPSSAPVPPEPGSLEAEHAQLKQNFATLEQRTNQLLQHHQNLEMQRQAQAVQQQIPQLELDPVGNIIARLDLSERAHLQQLQNQQVQQVYQRAEQVKSWVYNQTESFRNEQPQYDAAFEHLAAARVAELRALGMTDPAQIEQQCELDAQGIVAAAVQQGRNPAQAIFELARSRGFIPARGGRNSAMQNIDRISEGKRQSRSLSNARGAGPKAMSVNALLDASYDDFAAMIATPAGRDLLGA